MKLIGLAAIVFVAVIVWRYMRTHESSAESRWGVERAQEASLYALADERRASAVERRANATHTNVQTARAAYELERDATTEPTLPPVVARYLPAPIVEDHRDRR